MRNRLSTSVSTLTRRRFLAASGVTAAGALAAGGTVYGVDRLMSSGDGDPASAGEGASILVLVTLYGGNDGLGTVVPAADPAYRKARPDLAYAEDEVLDLGEGLGLNPGMKGFHSLWKDKRLAIVRGVSYPEPDHSHFRSMAIWQTASPKSPAPSGWLGRWLDSADDPSPLRAVSLGATLPPVLAGEKRAGAAVQLGGARLPDAWQRVCTELAELSKPAGGSAPAGTHPLLARAATTLGDVVAVSDASGTAGGTKSEQDAEAEEDARPADGASAGGQSGLAAQLGVVAQAVESGAPTRAYCVSLGGFDTHANEKTTQAQLLGTLDKAVGGFLERVRKTSAGRRVVVAVHSEFGRRVAANANQGTDHGTSAPLFVAGDPVRGGFYGDQPGLTDLDDGDLRTTTDFRDVYATLLRGVLDTEPARVLDGHERTLAFL